MEAGVNNPQAGRDKAVQTWRRIRRLSPILKLWGQGGGDENPTGDYSTDSAMRSLRSTIQSDRRAQRAVPAYAVKPIVRERQTVTRLLADVCNVSSSRLTWTFDVGGQPVAARVKAKRPRPGVIQIGSTRGSISIRVGFMWRKKVYEPLYARHNLDLSSWIILRAEEVRVNDRNIRLYEATAFHRNDGNTREVYIGQSRHEKQRAVMGFSAQAAIESARRIVADDIGRKIVGEEEKQP